MKYSFLIFLLSLVAIAAPASHKNEKNELAFDPSLEERLTSQSTFQSRPKDTLKSLARFLYGHESWWVKLKEENQSLSTFSPDQLLPIGTSLVYRSAKIGSTYTVQPNDWLIRIVLWKFGNSAKWNEIYGRSNHGMNKANMIHPGDVLKFEDDGTVRLEGSGEVLVAGLQVGESNASSNSSVKKLNRALAHSGSTRPQGTSQLSFQLGVAVSILFFFLVSFILWSLHVGTQNVEKEGKTRTRKKKSASRKAAKLKEKKTSNKTEDSSEESKDLQAS